MIARAEMTLTALLAAAANAVAAKTSSVGLSATSDLLDCNVLISIAGQIAYSENTSIDLHDAVDIAGDHWDMQTIYALFARNLGNDAPFHVSGTDADGLDAGINSGYYGQSIRVPAGASILLIAPGNRKWLNSGINMWNGAIDEAPQPVKYEVVVIGKGVLL